jgi:hypothetical protein
VSFSDFFFTFEVALGSLPIHCTYYSPGLIVAESDRATEENLKAYLSTFFTILLEIFPGLKGSSHAAEVGYGMKSWSTPPPLDDIMVLTSLDFVTRLMGLLRRHGPSTTSQADEFVLASEIDRRIAQSILSLRLFSSAVAQIRQPLFETAVSQCEFCLAFAQMQMNRLRFKVEVATSQSNIWIQRILIILTLLQIGTAVLIGWLTGHL